MIGGFEKGPESQLIDLIRERGPMTVAAFMEFALYDPEFGYYARAAKRSGRAGDFFTSVDVGPVFGELIARQIVDMAALLESPISGPQSPVDLVEAGAGSGRLAADVLGALRRAAPGVYERIRLHLVEASAAARAAQRDSLGDSSDRLASSSSELPERFEGVLIANELLDAMPVHQVVMRDGGLRETYVAVRDGHLTTLEGPPSTPMLREYLDREGIQLEPGWRAEISLKSVEWIRDATRSMARGFMILVDYGHPANELYSVTHSRGTLTAYSRHVISGPERTDRIPGWLEQPGERDITAHVDFTAIRRAAEREGASVLGFLDQTYFLLGLGAAQLDAADLKTRLAVKTLLMPGGLGSTLKVLILGKNVGAPALRGCSFRVRVT